MNNLNTETGFAAWSWMITVLIIVAFTLISCGTLPPQKPIRDLESIAGKWEGNLTVHMSQFGLVGVAANWDIHKDGTYEMATTRWRAKGTLRLDKGQLLFFDGPVASGFASLREGSEGKLLLSTGNEPGTSGTWWPVK